MDKAKDLFPRGLFQPSGSMRFGMDALLLACFAATEFTMQAPHGLKNPLREQAFDLYYPGYAALELGCGSGASIAGMLLLVDNLKGLGIDLSPLLIDAACANTKLLGLEKRLYCKTMDARSIALMTKRPFCDLVISNPPFWKNGTGHSCNTQLKEQARRTNNPLVLFAKAARTALVHHGHFFLINPASQLADIIPILAANNFGIRTLRFVRPFPSRCANRVLVEARKNMQHDIRVQPDLVIYDAQNNTSKILVPSADALKFCPWLHSPPKFH